MEEVQKGRVSPSITVLTPSAPPAVSGGVASAHTNLYHCLRKLGCRANLLSFNDRKLPSGDSGIVLFGASSRLKTLLDICTYLYLRMLGSRKQAYQLADIVFAIPGILQVNKYLKRRQPEILIIPDHGAPGLFLCKRNTPIVLIVHHVPSRFSFSPLLGDFCPLDVARATTLEQRVLKRVDVVVCPSEYMKQVFKTTYRFDGEITVIPNLIDEDWLDAVPVRDVRTELQLPIETPVVYIPSAGSLFKGSKYVYEIVRRLASACSGPLAFYLSGQIGDELLAELEHVPGNVRLLMPGLVSHEDNIGFVKSCSFGISPTLIENFGMAILEAGFCNVPMVAFEVGGNGEILCEGENGFLVPLLDIEGMLDKAGQMLDREYCFKLRRTTGQFVRNRFSSQHIAKEYLSLCERYIVARHGSK